MNATLAGLAATLLYVTASLLLGRQLARREKPSVPVILGLGALALPLHLLSVHSAIYQPGGIDLGLFHMVSLVGWLIATLAIGMSLYQPVVSITLGSLVSRCSRKFGRARNSKVSIWSANSRMS